MSEYWTKKDFKVIALVVSVYVYALFVVALMVYLGSISHAHDADFSALVVGLGTLAIFVPWGIGMAYICTNYKRVDE